MTEKELKELTDEELLDEAKKMRYNSILNATLIGIVIGVIIFGVAKNNFGFLALIPLFIVFKMFNNSPKDKALKSVLKERNLK